MISRILIQRSILKNFKFESLLKPAKNISHNGRFCANKNSAKPPPHPPPIHSFIHSTSSSSLCSSDLIKASSVLLLLLLLLHFLLQQFSSSNQVTENRAFSVCCSSSSSSGSDLLRRFSDLSRRLISEFIYLFIERKNKMTKVVWRYNFEESMRKIEEIVKTYPYVSMDTEFPGFLFNSPKDSDELTKYEDLRKNVDQMMLIQLGLTFSDENGKKPSEDSTWEFNFRDFDPDWDTHVPKSIEMLKKGGIDFETNKVAGISLMEFGFKFKKILLQNPNVRWIVFHGLYDIAYILKTIRGGRWSMPLSLGGFLHVVRVNFGRIFDLKHIAKFCPGLLLNGELSLARLGKILNVERIGTSHQAGSDSLLTSSAYSEMKIKYGFHEKRFQGYLFGIQSKIDTYQPMPILLPPPRPQPQPRPMVAVAGAYYYYRTPENLIVGCWKPHGLLYT